ncbi:MAG: hypothetical protein UX77_C0007G0021 [Parcubacteria group bacterium GW2011_GWA1_47_11]|uniref:Uncharacterized protein n=1 Tax=Candidatus Colwellbacteria bacterium GWA2_46_10 TaxID=1797684 RepID=A0A1G1YWY4_9BACT|nr:MAG: hypothetical protein UX29_C0013G0004 [Parcubacteria group bacterium GW2011_GWA2_46_10]KKU55816.1 MAG: hypothetical protein UX77_C0007G0021 [Parcubacteria group bacterium GW2011_GWA1_47_11]OGY56898.1 MAG: hypothetical protein A2119_02650 [Candidatus Colwellbacteria bacterium GWA2_46_10]
MGISQKTKLGAIDTPTSKGDVLRITFKTKVAPQGGVVLASDDANARSTLLGNYSRGGNGSAYVIANAAWPVDDNFSGYYRVTEETVVVPLTNIEHVSRGGPGRKKPINEPQ